VVAACNLIGSAKRAQSLQTIGGAVESDPLAIETEAVSRGEREIVGEHSEVAKMRRRTRVAVFYSVQLCKAVAAYRPFWIEEPICPEHVDGYARIKEETGVTIAGGEHWHTRWQVKPFLERKCVDFVQSDPVWCGGISEWLEVCRLARACPGVKVVPHITSPWIVAPHCVASQSEELCPLLEFNYEGGRKALDGRMNRSLDGGVVMKMPGTPGITRTNR